MTATRGVPSHLTARRSLRAWGGYLLATAWATVILQPQLRAWHVPADLTLLVAVVIAATLASPVFQVLDAKQSVDYGLLRRMRPLRLATRSAVSVLIVEVVTTLAAGPPPLFGAVPVTAGAVFVIWTGIYQLAAEARDSTLGRLLEVESRHAEELAERCREALAEADDAGLDDASRGLIELNLANALLALPLEHGVSAALAEALAIFDRLADSDEPALAFFAAVGLTEAIQIKAERIGDETGWDAALDRLEAAAAAAEPFIPQASGIPLAARAARAQHQAMAENGDLPRSAELQETARSLWDEAAKATPVELDDHVLHLVAAAQMAGSHPLHGDLDGAIRDCRRATRRLRLVDSDDCAMAQCALADLLELRATIAPESPRGRAWTKLWKHDLGLGFVASLWPDRATTDLLWAHWLCLQAAASDMHGPGARTRLLQLWHALRERGWRPVRRLADRQANWMHSRVVAEQMNLSRTAAAQLSLRWASWAAARGEHEQEAEAWWCWVTAMAADLRGRVFDDKERRLPGVQWMFHEAAQRLVDVDRLADAAVTLDLGRAVLLTDRMHRDQEGLEMRLRAAGHGELAERWRTARAQAGQADRAGFGSMRLKAAVDERAIASAEYEALAATEQVLREVSQLPGFEDVDPAVDYDDLRAAAQDGPLVYVAAYEKNGFALVVGDERPAPRLVVLPDLAARVVEGRLALLKVVDDLADERERTREMNLALEKVLPWLWDTVLEPVHALLPPESTVTLIPVGELTELPLHAAGLAPDADGVWRDRTAGVTFRYAPNARVLRRAAGTAQALEGDDLRVLTVGVEHARGWPRLRSAPAESEAVAARFGEGRARRAIPPVVSTVLSALDACEIWHFACHGRHDPSAPLESCLALQDDELTVRQLLATASGRRRLAVLSACQTARVDETRRDEVIGFPAAMLQAGVAGVVACHAKVDDRQASLLVVEFFARLERGRPSVRALAEAQAWLRTATNAELHDAYPQLHRLPLGDAELHARWGRERPFTSPATWALFAYTGA